MILPITKIKHRLAMSRKYQLEGQLSAQVAKLVDGFDLAQPISFDGKAVNRGDGLFLVEGSFATSLHLECSRCLQTFDLPISGELHALYGSESGIDSETELVIHAFQGDDIDISDALLAEINFELPMQPLCRRDCQGLCPDCGIDLNQQTCTCAKDRIDPRWEKLKNFQFNRDE